MWRTSYIQKEGSERGLKIGKIIKAQQPEVYEQLKKERKENFSYSKEGSEKRFEDRKNN